jgi:integrase
MIAWPDNDGATIDRYVRQLRVRHPRTRQVYRGEMRRFQRFIQDQGELSVESVSAWLRARTKQWPRHLVMDRACKVNRFLDFLVEEGTLPTHPLAELRSRYGRPALAWIVRALLSPKPSAALEAVRPLPRFGSFLGGFLQDHIELRQSLGFRFNTQAGRFATFDRFLQLRPDLKGKAIPVLVREFENTAKTPEQRWRCQLMGRNLARAWARIDPSIPPMRPDPRLKSRILAARRRPYIYTPQQIRQILDTARNFPSPRTPLRPLTLYTMVVLAYCAGLRLGELLRLDLGDVSLEDSTITIRDTKFFKSRCLPLTDSAVSALREYLFERAKQGGSRCVSAPLFWRQTRDGGGRYSRITVVILMERILRDAGLKPASGRRGPRFHDVRHSFVNHRMTDWYRNGINPQAHLPYLATYLGHRDIYSTLAYLNTTPELLQLASERFRSYVQGANTMDARRRP